MRLSQAKSHELFYIWVTKLQAHRLYKRTEAAHVHSGLLAALSHCAAGVPDHKNGDLVMMASGGAQRIQSELRVTSVSSVCPQSSAGLADLTVAPGVPPSASTAANKKVSAWLQQSHQPDACAQGKRHRAAEAERRAEGV